VATTTRSIASLSSSPGERATRWCTNRGSSAYRSTRRGSSPELKIEDSTPAKSSVDEVTTGHHGVWELTSPLEQLGHDLPVPDRSIQGSDMSSPVIRTVAGGSATQLAIRFPKG